MINSALLWFFATCAIFLVDPSTGRSLDVEQAALNNSGHLPKLEFSRFIDVNHAKHPNQLCKKNVDPKLVVIWQAMVEREKNESFCSKPIKCIFSNSRHPSFELSEKPAGGVQCKSNYESDTDRFVCIRERCTLVPGLFPNAPKDQDEA